MPELQKLTCLKKDPARPENKKRHDRDSESGQEFEYHAVLGRKKTATLLATLLAPL